MTCFEQNPPWLPIKPVGIMKDTSQILIGYRLDLHDNRECVQPVLPWVPLELLLKPG